MLRTAQRKLRYRITRLATAWKEKNSRQACQQPIHAVVEGNPLVCKRKESWSLDTYARKRKRARKLQTHSCTCTSYCCTKSRGALLELCYEGRSEINDPYLILLVQ